MRKTALFIDKKTLIVDVPIESTEYKIDVFLANTLQYKINDKWVYDTDVLLPSEQLKVIGIEENKNIYYEPPTGRKWLKIMMV